MKSIVLMLSFAAMFVSTSMFAQQVGTITADPNAQPLRKIWQVNGKPFIGGDHVGENVVGLGDIYGTGKGAWGVYYGTVRQSRIFRNDSADIAKDTAAVQVFDSMGVALSGDFWGTGHRAVGFARSDVDLTNPDLPIYYYKFLVHRTDSGRIATSPSAVLRTRNMNPPRRLTMPNAMLAADLDGDGADELILAMGGIGLDTGVSKFPELWIYKGGAGFQLDSPTVIVRHPFYNGQVDIGAVVGDFDGDHHVDIAISRGNNGGGNHLTFYWGTGDILAFADTNNRRVVNLTSGYPDAGIGITALDCDGDGVTDLATDLTYQQPRGTYLYRSGAGKNARTRSYRLDDADLVFDGAPVHLNGGYLNDSSRRYEMLALGRLETEPPGRPPMTLFAGGDRGPDFAYDAYNNDAFGHLPIDDVDGDGWNDCMGWNGHYDHEGGIAVIYAGGPYIPGPKTSGVDVVAGEGHDRAIAIWPNPAMNELHIAWRGDLKNMPTRFAVYDLLGNDIAHGSVEPWRGAALWNCSAVAAGVYVLTISDDRGALIATKRIVKQ